MYIWLNTILQGGVLTPKTPPCVRLWERPRLYRKKGDGNGVTGKEEKREAEEKISRCSEGRHMGS